MLEIMKTETALNAIKDTTIKGHIELAYKAALDIDKSAVKIAYHVACIKPLLEGNTDGLPTDFVKFCETRLGIKKAQSFNMLAIGNHVDRIVKDGKAIYLDVFTRKAIENESTENGSINWDKYYNKCRKAKSLGSTQILTVLQAMAKREITDDDIAELISKGTIHAGLKIKELSALLSGKFQLTQKAAEKAAKKEEGKTEEDKTEEGKTEEGKTEEGKTEEGKTETETESRKKLDDMISNNALSAIIKMYGGTEYSQLALYEQFCFCTYMAIQTGIAGFEEIKAKSADFEQKAVSLRKLLDEILE